MDEEAVSPVIGVVLMCAITVVLAAVVFVLVNGRLEEEKAAPWCEDGDIVWTGNSTYDEGRTMKQYECQDRRGHALDVKWAESQKDL